MKNVFRCNNRNMWFCARRDCVDVGWFRWMIEVRLSPTCAFLSCRAGREQRKNVERRGDVKCVRAAEASASWSPLVVVSFVDESVGAQKGPSCKYRALKKNKTNKKRHF